MALEDLYARIVGDAARVLRRNCVVPRTLNADYAADLRTSGGTVDVPIPATIATRTVVPGPVPPGAPRPIPKTKPVSLNYHEEAPFSLTDRDVSSMENSDSYMPRQLESAVVALAERVDTTCIEKVYPAIYGFAGTPGTTPFAASLVQAQEAIKILAEQKAPKGRGMRHLVTDPSAYANAVGFLVNTPRFDAVGQQATIEGEIPYAVGFMWHEDQGIVRHVNANGTPAGWLINTAAHAVGATTVPIDTGANNPVAGDVFTVAGSTQTYTVVSYAAGVLTYSPAAKSVFADNAAVTFKAAHTVNLAYHRDIAAFASRPLDDIGFKGGSEIFTYVDDIGEDMAGTGLVFRLEIKRQHYQVEFALSAMWGIEVVLAELGCRIAG